MHRNRHFQKYVSMRVVVDVRRLCVPKGVVNLSFLVSRFNVDGNVFDFTFSFSDAVDGQIIELRFYRRRRVGGNRFYLHQRRVVYVDRLRGTNRRVRQAAKGEQELFVVEVAILFIACGKFRSDDGGLSFGDGIGCGRCCFSFGGVVGYYGEKVANISVKS